MSLTSVRVRNDLLWWIKDSGFRGNSATSWSPPKSDVDVWSDASPWGEGAVNSHGDYFQRSWTETESCQHINLLEIRAAKEGIQELVDPHETVRPHIDNTTACAYIRKIGGTRSVSLCQESLKLWREVVSRDVHVLSPFWLSSLDNLEADFLSRQALLAWDFQLSRNFSTDLLSVSGQTDTGCICNQQDQSPPTVHDLGAGRVRGRPELSQLLLGSSNLAVSPGPPNPSCAARSGGAADRGDSHLPGLETGSVVASSVQDVGSAHSVASSLPSMPQLPRIHNTSGIQYGPSSGSSHQEQPIIASDNSVVLNQDNYDFLDHHIATNTKQKYTSAWQQFCTFCNGLNVQPITCSVAVIVKYIRHRFEEGASYSTMNVAKSAISKFHCFLPGNVPVGSDQLVKKAMKSFFKLRPPLPKY